MESKSIQSFIGNHVLDRRIRITLSNAKITFCEFNLTTRAINWSVDQSFHFFEFSKSYDGTLEGYFNLIHEEDRDFVKAAIEQPNDEQNLTISFRVKWIDGTYHWMECIGRFYEENGMSLLVGTIQDITVRKTLELEREEWEQRHKLVADAAGVIVYDYDIESGQIFWSGNIKEILQFSESEMGDIDRWGELIHPEDRDEAFKLLDEAQERLKPYEVYYRFRRKDGNYRQMHDKGTFIAKNGKAVRMLGMMNDVTEFMYSRLALEESENRFKSLMNSLNVGVALFSPDMAPIIHNKAAYELLGLTENEFKGRTVADPEWNVLDGDGNPMQVDEFPVAQCLRSEKAIRQVVMGVLRPSLKDRVWLMVDAEPIFNNEGHIDHVICTYSNFSVRKHMEELLTEKNQQLLNTTSELESRNQRLMEFAQIVSHNLRSPISSIAGLSDLYFSKDYKEKDQAVKYIQEVCNKALETIEDLNKVLKTQQGERLPVDRVSFRDVINSVKKLMKIALIEKEILLKIDFKDAPYINYPSVFLESILLNLLSNAIKYSRKNVRPEINIVSKREGKDVVLIFSDNGIGINLDKHFNDIFSFGKTFHNRPNSKGIGLFLVKDQLRTMGDDISIESTVNKGTIFKITFKNQDHGE